MTQHLSVLGIDIAKRLFHVVGMNERGQIGLRKRLFRHALMPCIATLPPVRSGMEACGGAHSWARRFRAHGHAGKLMAPQCVNPSVQAHKNALRDAAALAEAGTRPPRRCVPAKNVAPQDIPALHRVRERLRGERTARVNAVHGLLHEYGMVMPKGVAKYRQVVSETREAAQDKRTPLRQERLWHWVNELAA